MNKQLERYLVTKYPLIFKDIGGEIECGSGWFWILDALCTNIDNAYKNAVRQWELVVSQNKELAGVECPYMVQIKEKFGGLRVYTHNNMEGWARDTLSYVDMAETMAYRTCENCGEPAALVNDSGWMRMECEVCTHHRLGPDTQQELKTREYNFALVSLEILDKRKEEQEF